MVATKDEVCRLAALELGVTATGQAAGATTFGTIQSVFDDVLAELQGNELVGWGTNETPDECKQALGVYVAQRCANALATSDDVKAYLIGLGLKPRMDLAAVAGKKWSGASTTVDRF